MEYATLLTLIGILILLGLSAFFSGSETALTAASRPRMHQLQINGSRRAGLVNALRQQQERLIGTILLGNNLVNILASALATSVLITLAGETGVIYATISMTILVLIFGEIPSQDLRISKRRQCRLAGCNRCYAFWCSCLRRS